MSHTLEGSADELDAARAAFDQHDWAVARELFLRTDDHGGLDARDLEHLAEATWWLARLEDAISIRERAYASYLREGERAAAARVALWLVLDYSARLRHTLARGALSRAERLLADEEEGPAHAQLATIRAMGALDQGDIDTALALAREAEGLSRRFADPDWESLALLVQGKALVVQGAVEEGLQLMDRATVAAVGDELQPFTTGVVYCMTIGACADLADYGRAGEWTEAAEQWCSRQAMPSGFPGICRVHRAEVKRITGDWPQAEEEARRAAVELQDSFLDTAGAAFSEIGEIRLRLGDLDAAEAAFQQAHGFGHDPQPGMALLRLAQGRVDAAASGVRSALDNPFLTPLGRAKLLPAQVQIALASGDQAAAAAAAAELEEIAERYRSPSPALRAVAAVGRARVELASGDGAAALTCMRAALRDWQLVRAPYEVACARALLAEAHRLLGDHDAAVFELRSAHATFERLGAVPDARRAAALVADETAPEHLDRALLFTDIVTSTDLIEVIGDDAWADLVRWHDQALREQFRANGGEEVDHAGDGFFVAFAEAAAAMACAIAIQQRLREHRRTAGFAPRVRIGVHSAEALRDDAGYHGRAVHEAARIAALAGGGEILASRAAVEAAGAGVAVSGWRTVALKGISDAVEIAAVDWQTTT